VDIWVLLALAAIFFFGIVGFRDGVVKRILEIAGVLVTLVLTARFASAVQPTLVAKTGLHDGPALLLAWGLLFFAGLVLSRLLATVVRKMVRLTVLGWLDKWGGAVVGLAFGLLVTSAILVAASMVPGGERIQAAYDRVPLGRFIFYAAPTVYQEARRVAGGDVDEVWRRVLTVTREKTAEGKARVADELKEAAGE
jgi:membrane protein required for colicin V production